MRGRNVSLAVGLVALVALAAPQSFSRQIQSGASAFLAAFGGWTLFVAAACVILCFAVLVLPRGRQIIGGPDAKPEFRTVTWTAMMFAAGMGAGLVFWGAAEPVIHTNTPPPGEGLVPGGAEARGRALAITQFHWGLHAWSIYGAAALAVGMAATARHAMTPSAPFTKLPSRLRRAVDIVALFAVLFGIVASLGQGILQVGAGFETLTGGAIPDGAEVRIGFLALLTIAYLGSAILGLRRGIAVLSNINVVLAFLLAAFIFAASPAGVILETFAESLAGYARSLPELSVTLREPGPARQWTQDWSLTYFLWWMAWTPFVGVFLARISRGRSLRSFVLAAVVAPSILTLIWFSILGGAALAAEAGGASLGVESFETAPLATYRLLATLPLAPLFQGLTIVLVMIFLITSADSGAYVLAMFSEETSSPGVAPRLYWGAILAVMTGAALLSGDGQNATRAVAVAGAVPMTFLLAAQGVTVGWRAFVENRAQNSPSLRASRSSDSDSERPASSR